MTIHKLVGKHTTGDVRDYVGSPGELFYDDATGLIRLADGFTEGGNALELHQFEDQFVMLTSYEADCEAATSISTDGVNWTDAFASTEYVDTGPDYESVNFYQTAIGGGHIVYLGYDNDATQNCLFWAETANQAANRSFSPASRRGDEANGMDNCLWLEDVEYINGYFIAVGYQERFEADYNGGTYVKYPYWSYSKTGEHWTYGKVDYAFCKTILLASDQLLSRNNGGLRIECVGGDSSSGMLFTLRFNNSFYPGNPGAGYGSPGYFFVTDAETGSMDAGSYSGLAVLGNYGEPFLSEDGNNGFRSVFHDDHGWIVYVNNTGYVWFNSSPDPRQGKWRRSSFSQIANSTFGDHGWCIYYAAAGRLKDGKSWFMMIGNDGRYYATADQGGSWSAGVVGPCYQQAINTVDRGTSTILHFDSGTNWAYGGYYYWNKIKITGSNIPEMNGIFYAHRTNATTFRLSHDATGDNWVDSTAWASYNSGDATCLFSYAHSAKTYLTHGAGTFIAVDDGAPYVWSTTDLTTTWDFNDYTPYDPVTGDITGNSPADFTWTSGIWKGVLAQYQWVGNWTGIGNISFGRIGTQSGLLRSQSRRISGRTNSLNLADNFSVGVINGVQGGETIGYGKIELRPGLPGGVWFIGAGYGFGPGTSIGSEKPSEPNADYSRVAITIMDGNVWSFRTDGIYYNNVKKVSV